MAAGTENLWMMDENTENLPMANVNVKEMFTTLTSNKLDKNRYSAYSFLVSSLESQKDAAKTIQPYSSQLFKYLSRDVLSQEHDVITVVTKIILYCVKDKQFLERITKDEAEGLLLAVLKAGKEKQSEDITKQLLSILSQQQFPSDIVISHVADILDALECIFTDGNGKALYMTNIMDVIFSLHERIASNLTPHSQRWCRMVFPCLGHPLAPVRANSFDLLKHYKSSIVGSLELGKFVLKSVDNDLGKHLITLVAKNPQYVMDVWSFVLDIAGKAIHKGSTINVMLEIIEHGFKGTPESRVAAFKAWRSLIDNFALEQDVISDAKRIRLLMMVLKTNNAKTEAVALEKLYTWWHFVRSIGNKLSSVLEQILYPLLQFCVGCPNQPSQNACPSPNFALKMSPCASKALATIQSRMGSQQLPTFPALQKIGLEVIGHLVSRFGESNKIQGFKWSIDALPTEVFASSAIFVKHAPFIMSSLETILKSVGSQDREALVVHIWTNLSVYLKAALEKGGKVECRDVFGAFLSLFHTLVQADCFQPQMLVSLFRTTSDFPNKVLSSTLYNTGIGTAVKGCPALLLCEVLFMPAFLRVSSEEETYLQLFNGIVTAGASKQQAALPFIQSIADILDSASANLVSTDLLYRLWSILAHTLLDVVTATNEVNQGDALEYNFGCLYAVLLLPVQHQLASKVSQGVCKSMLRTWKELYHSFARLSALVGNAEANTCLEEISAKIIGVWRPEFKDPASLEYLASVCMKMLDCADFSAISAGNKQNSFTLSPSKWTKRRQRPLANLHSYVHLLEKMQLESNALFDQLGDKTFAQKQVAPSGCVQAYTNHVLDIYTRLFSHIPTTVVPHVLTALAAPMARLFHSKAQSTGSVKVFVPSVLSKVEKLWFEICNCITGRYNEQYDSTFLATLSPILEATFSHSRRAIKSQTLTFWTGTFSKSVGLNYPDSLKPVLSLIKEKTSIVLPGWIAFEDSVIAETPFTEVSQSQGDSQVPIPVLIGLPSPKRQQKGSFLHKDLSPAQKSPSTNKPSPAKVISPKDAKALFSSRRNISADLNMMSDKDFVVIASPTTKQRVLTEHQKEVLKEKRIIPVMYNNLDASQDTSLMAQLSTESQQESMSCTDVITVNDSQASQEKGKAIGNILASKDSSSSSGGFTVPKQMRHLSRRRSVRIQEKSSDDEIDSLKEKECVDKKMEKSSLKESEKVQEKDCSDKHQLLSTDGKNDSSKQKVDKDKEADMVLSSLEPSVEIPLDTPESADTSSSTSGKLEVPAFGMFRTKNSSSNTQQDMTKKGSSSNTTEVRPKRVSLRKINSHDGESSLDAPNIVKNTELQMNKGKSPRRVPLQRIHDQKSANQTGAASAEPETKKSDPVVISHEDKTKDESEMVAEPKKTRSSLEKWLAKSNPPKIARRESPRKKRKFCELEDEISDGEKSPIIPITLVEDTQSPGKAGCSHIESISYIAETPVKSDDSPSPAIRSVRKLFADDVPVTNIGICDTPKRPDVKMVSSLENEVKSTDLNNDEVNLSQGFVTTQEEEQAMVVDTFEQHIGDTLQSSSKEANTNADIQEMAQSENLFASSEETPDSLEPLMTMHMPTLAYQTKDFGISSSSSCSKSSSSVESDPKDKTMSGTESEFDPSQATLRDEWNKITSIVKRKTVVRETLASTRTRRTNIKRKGPKGKNPMTSSSSQCEDELTSLADVNEVNKDQIESEIVDASEQRSSDENNKEKETSQKESEGQSSFEMGEVTPIVKSTNDNSSTQRCSTTKKKRLIAKQLAEERQVGLESPEASSTKSVAIDVKSEKLERKIGTKLDGRLVSTARRKISPTVSPPGMRRSRHMLRIRTKAVKRLSQSPPSKRRRCEKKDASIDLIEDSSMDDLPLSSLVEKTNSLPDPCDKDKVEEVPAKEKEVTAEVSDDEDQPLSSLVAAKAEEAKAISVNDELEENAKQDPISIDQPDSFDVVLVDPSQDGIMEVEEVQSSSQNDDGCESKKESEQNAAEDRNCIPEEMLSTAEEIPPGQVVPPMEIEESDQSTGSDEVFDSAKDSSLPSTTDGLTRSSDVIMEVEQVTEKSDAIVEHLSNDTESKMGEQSLDATDKKTGETLESEETTINNVPEEKCDGEDNASDESRQNSQEEQKEAPEFVLSDWSPSKSPSCSILRKVSTPSSGDKYRRKVYFAEPVVSGESPVREKYHSESLPTSPLICHSYSLALTRPGSPGIKPNRGSSYRRRLDTSLKKQVHGNLRQRCAPSPSPSPSSQNVYTATPESQLNSVNPIFPDLVDCKASLDCILPQLTSSLWYRGLCQLMKGRNLHTIGDLSALTEVQVNQMPIRCPKVTTVLDALTNYQNQHGGASTPRSQSKSIFGNTTPSLDRSDNASISQEQGTPRSNGATLSQEVTPSSIADEGIKILPSAEQDLSQLSPIKEDSNVKLTTTKAALTPSVPQESTSSASTSSSVLSSSATSGTSSTNIVNMLLNVTDKHSLSELKGLSMAQLFDVHQKLNNLFGAVVEEMKERSLQS